MSVTMSFQVDVRGYNFFIFLVASSLRRIMHLVVSPQKEHLYSLPTPVEQVRKTLVCASHRNYAVELDCRLHEK